METPENTHYNGNRTYRYSTENSLDKTMLFIMTTVGLQVQVHALQTTMLSNKAEQGVARSMKHLSTVVSQCYMLQNKVGCT